MHESFMKLSTPVRLAYLAIATGFWALTLGGRLMRGRAVILCYHNVRADQAKRFERQAKMAASRTVSLAAVSELPRKARPRIVFTFDDAYANLLTTVAPVMRRLGSPWSVFPVTGALGTAPTWSMPDGHPDTHEVTMTRDEVRSLAADPLVEIGAHTRTHPPMAEVRDPERLRTELVFPREELASITSRPVDSLALPYGSFSFCALDAASDVGYVRILTLEEANEPRRIRVRDAAILGRFPCSPDIYGAEFRLLIDGAYCWLWGFRSLIRRMKGAEA